MSSFSNVIARISPLEKDQQIAAHFADLAKNATRVFNEEFLKDPPSVAINRWVDEVAKKSKAAAKKVAGKDGGLLGGLIGSGTDKIGKIANLFGKAGAFADKAQKAANAATLKAALFGTGLKAPAITPGLSASNSGGAALERGSTEAFSATRFAKRSDDQIKKVADNTKRQLVEEKKANVTLDVIAGLLGRTVGDLIPL